ncbi:hypothetical protein [Xanthomonas sp. BRIP62411]|uniref:hypothetical protein n=1 Tax=Xanthomonas sp. BRIP62411 TaxID=2182389 RepID=UPI000F8E2C87
MACVFCAGESEPEREARFGSGLFHGAEALPSPFFAVLRVEALLLAAGRRAAVLFVAVFFAGLFFAVAFLTAVFLAAVFFTAAFLAAVVPVALRAPVDDLDVDVPALPAAALPAASFLAEGFFVEAVAVVFLAAFFAAVFLAVRFAAVCPAVRVFVPLAPAAAVLLVPVPFPALVFALAASCRRWYSRAAQRWPASPPQSSQAM